MPPQQVPIPPPLLGLNKRASYSMKPEGYAADSLNVWPTDWDQGHERISTRPPVVTSSSLGGEPLNWSPVSWADDDGGSTIGTAVITSSGLEFSADGSTWSSKWSFNPSSNFATVTSFVNRLYVAEYSADAKEWDPNRSTNATRNLDAAVAAHMTAEAEAAAAANNEDPPDAIGVGDLEGLGNVPPKDCGIVQAWGDRLVFAGSEESPHVAFMSALGDPYDWDYSSVARNAAVSTSGIDGIIGEPITSLIPHNRQCLLVGCTDSIYVIRGNPAAGGQIETLSHSVGPLEHSAWCKDGEDRTWMMTRDGLYVMPPGCGSPPVKASRQVIPNDLVGINPGRDGSQGDRVSLCYDNRFNGLHIVVNYSSGPEDVSYFYDLANGGYWRQTFGQEMHLCCSVKHASSEDRSGAILINRSGTAYYFDRTGTEVRDSHCYYGPLAVGSPMNDGLLMSIEGAVGSHSSPVVLELYGSHSPEEAFLLTEPTFTCDAWSVDGTRQWQNRQWPRMRCAAAYVKATSQDGLPWVIEELVATTDERAHKRV